MKKLMKYWSIILNIILFLLLIFTLQNQDNEVELVELPDLSKFTQDNIDKAVDITSGMSIKEILHLMGKPVVKEIELNEEEWHYCKTGHIVDEYISIKFVEDKVVSLSFYTVNSLDVSFHYTSSPSVELLQAGSLGDCKLTIRWGTYDQKLQTNSPPPPISRHPLIRYPYTFRRLTRLEEYVNGDAAAGVPVATDAQPFGF